MPEAPQMLRQEVANVPLMASWDFCEVAGSAAAADGTGHANPLTLGTGASFHAAGRFGNGLFLDNTNGPCKLTAPSSMWLQGPQAAITLELWINPVGLDVGTGRSELIRKGNGASYDLWLFNAGAGQATVAFTQRDAMGVDHNLDATGYTIPSCPLDRLALNSGWHHVAATNDGATSRIYIDGAQVCSRATPMSGRAYDGSPLCLGMDSFNVAHFYGWLDDVRIYSGALSAAQIQADFADTAPRRTVLTWSGPQMLPAARAATYTARALDGCGLVDLRNGNALTWTAMPAGAVYPGFTSLSAGTSTNTFYSLAPRLYTLNAFDGVFGASNTVLVTPDTLAFTNMPLVQPPGACGAMAVELRNGGAPVPVAQDVTVNLATTGQARFFSDAACTAPVSTATIPLNGASATFFISDMQSETVTVSVSSVPSGAGTYTQQATFSPGAVDHFEVGATLPTVPAGGSGTPVVALAKDRFDNTITSYGGAVTFTASPDAGVFSPASSVADAGRAQTVFSAAAPGAYTVTAQAAGRTGSTVVTVTPATLAFTSPPLAVVAGQCGAISVALNVRAAADVTVRVTSTGQGELFAAADCSGSPVGAVVLKAGSTEVTFGFRDPVPERAVVGVTSTPSGPAVFTQAQTVGAHGPLHHFDVLATPGRFPAGGAAEVSSIARDAFGNTVTSFSGSVRFEASPSGGSLDVTTVNASAGVASARFSAPSPGTFTVSAAGSSAAARGAASVQVGADGLVFVNAPLALPAGACGAVTVELFASGRPVAALAPVGLSLTASGSGRLFAAERCAGEPASSLTASIPAGAPRTTVWFSNDEPGMSVVSVSSAVTGSAEFRQEEVTTARGCGCGAAPGGVLVLLLLALTGRSAAPRRRGR